MVQRAHFAARSLNPPEFQEGDKCCVAGPSYFADIGSGFKTCNNHGRVVDFDSMLNTYLVQLVGIPDLLPEQHPVIKVKKEDIDRRLHNSSYDFK